MEPTGLGKQQDERTTPRPTRQPAVGQLTLVAAQFRAELVADRYGGVEDFARAKWIPRQLDPPESALGVKRASTHQLCVAQASPISTP